MDKFSNHEVSLTSPSDDGFSITKSDTVDVSIIPRGFSINADGIVKYITPKGTTLSEYLLAGMVHPIRVKRIFDTGTAGGISSIIGHV